MEGKKGISEDWLSLWMGLLIFVLGLGVLLVAATAAEGAHARYLELRSTKGHDAFLVEWDQLGAIVGDVLAAALAPRPVVRPRPARAGPTAGSRPL